MRAVSPIKVAEIPLIEANYVRETVAQIWEDMPVWLCGSLLIATSALPTILIGLLTGYGPLLAAGLFTLAPAWVACCYMMGRAAIHQKPRLGDFFGALVHYYGQSCLLVLPIVIVLVMVIVSFPLLTSVTSVLFTAGVAFQIAALFIALAIFIFAAPILSLFQVAFHQAWTYGLVLMVRSPIVALGLLSMAFLLVLAANSLGLGLWLVIPLLFIPFEVNATLMLVKKITEEERARDPSK